MTDALREHVHVRQIPGEPRRRWFSSGQFDLIVWLNDDDTFAGFELCYDKRDREHTLLWRPGSGFAHMAVDSGEHRPGKHKASPVLTPDGHFDAGRICAEFIKEARYLPEDVMEYVLRTMEHHPEFGPSSRTVGPAAPPEKT